MVGPDGDPVTATFFDMKTGRGHKDAALIALAPQMAEAHLAMVERLEKAEKLAEASERLKSLEDDTSPFGGEMMRDRIERTVEDFTAALVAYRGEDG
jgi:hypothetical protein